jgi:transcription initiation factor TFIIIB Brf1 subunit/transcription initiation factor TFIIB
MFNQNIPADTKIAVLEERLSAYELMLKRIDEAIQIVSKTNQNISKMLAVHEERIEQCHKADDYIGRLVEELKLESKDRHETVSERIDKIEEDVQEIGKIKWMTVGCGVLLAVLTTAFSTLASGWWTPSEMQMQRQGHSHQQNVADQNK